MMDDPAAGRVARPCDTAVADVEPGPGGNRGQVVLVRDGPADLLIDPGAERHGAGQATIGALPGVQVKLMVARPRYHPARR